MTHIRETPVCLSLLRPLAVLARSLVDLQWKKVLHNLSEATALKKVTTETGDILIQQWFSFLHLNSSQLMQSAAKISLDTVFAESGRIEETFRLGYIIPAPFDDKV